jgi:uncharacterized protein (DUF305 family)
VDVTEAVEDDDVVVLSWWQHPANVIALVVASLLIAGMVGWLIGEASPSADDGGPVDIGFLQDMRRHHEQAVEMALIYHGLEDTDPGLRTIAGSILITQNLDIGQMIELLRIMGAPEAAETDEAMAWMGMPTTTYRAMPGMATDEQIAELAASSGAEADRLFVELMVAHHQGGLHMAEYAAAEAENAEVRSLATSIAEGQQGEVVEMEDRLTESQPSG